MLLGGNIQTVPSNILFYYFIFSVRLWKGYSYGWYSSGQINDPEPDIANGCVSPHHHPVSLTTIILSICKEKGLWLLTLKKERKMFWDLNTQTHYHSAKWCESSPKRVQTITHLWFDVFFIYLLYTCTRGRKIMPFCGSSRPGITV